jgi:D-glycero-alpha-D-manno-heptose 1-phosphate guanylyltransferase
MDLKIIILAGGLGTRLREILGSVPKPMASVKDKPFLDYLIKFFSKQGFNEIIISCGYRADTIINHFGGSVSGVKIHYTVEQELLGTGGAIKLSESIIDSREFIVTNGDTFFEIDLKEMLQAHILRGALATMALVEREDTGRYGRVSFGKNCEIISFEEKIPDAGKGYINAGIYIFSKKVFSFIPSDRACSLESEVLPDLIGKGLYGFPVQGYFIDIGIPEDYERARKELPLRIDV